jgi:cytochrome c-type biogenesis protein CcmH/NrfG
MNLNPHAQSTRHVIVLIVAIVAVFAVWTAKYLLRPAPEVKPAGEMMTAVRAQIEHLEQLLENDPDNPEILTALGNVYYDAGMAEPAVAYYDRALAQEPGNINVLVDKATMLRLVGRSTEAIQILQQVVTAAPGHEQALYNLGVIYLTDFADTASAVTAWTAFLEANPAAERAALVQQELQRLQGIVPEQKLPE